jgi:hypothetical protein
MQLHNVPIDICGNIAEFLASPSDFFTLLRINHHWHNAVTEPHVWRHFITQAAPSKIRAASQTKDPKYLKKIYAKTMNNIIIFNWPRVANSLRLAFRMRRTIEYSYDECWNKINSVLATIEPYKRHHDAFCQMFYKQYKTSLLEKLLQDSTKINDQNITQRALEFVLHMFPPHESRTEKVVIAALSCNATVARQVLHKFASNMTTSTSLIGIVLYETTDQEAKINTLMECESYKYDTYKFDHHDLRLSTYLLRAADYLKNIPKDRLNIRNNVLSIIVGEHKYVSNHILEPLFTLFIELGAVVNEKVLYELCKRASREAYVLLSNILKSHKKITSSEPFMGIIDSFIGTDRGEYERHMYVLIDMLKLLKEYGITEDPNLNVTVWDRPLNALLESYLLRDLMLEKLDIDLSLASEFLFLFLDSVHVDGLNVKREQRTVLGSVHRHWTSQVEELPSDDNLAMKVVRYLQERGAECTYNNQWKNI